MGEKKNVKLCQFTESKLIIFMLLLAYFQSEVSKKKIHGKPWETLSLQWSMTSSSQILQHQCVYTESNKNRPILQKNGHSESISLKVRWNMLHTRITFLRGWKSEVLSLVFRSWIMSSFLIHLKQFFSVTSSPGRQLKISWVSAVKNKGKLSGWPMEKRKIAWYFQSIV